MNIEQLNQLLEGSGLLVTGVYSHSKASEDYVAVQITDASGTRIWEDSIPYKDRRARLNLDTEQKIAEYLRSIHQNFEPDNVRKWVTAERKYWKKNFSRAAVTTPFFKRLLRMDWVMGNGFPQNQNPQRRIQDIKDKGYTVVSMREGTGWKRKLVPLPRRTAHVYETISPELRSRILSVLNSENVYELSTANQAGLLPDHKFPEIRWDTETPRANPNDMPEADIRAKFQLLDNQRNEQKREVCRNCFQTGARGVLFGLNFFYVGTSQWNKAIPKTGLAAEAGCVGCGWYDIQTWRQALNNRIRE